MLCKKYLKFLNKAHTHTKKNDWQNLFCQIKIGPYRVQYNYTSFDTILQAFLLCWLRHLQLPQRNYLHDLSGLKTPQKNVRSYQVSSMLRTRYSLRFWKKSLAKCNILAMVHYRDAKSARNFGDFKDIRHTKFHFKYKIYAKFLFD